MKIALATPRPARDVAEALARIERCIADAAGQRAEIVCFPEAYLPGLRGLDFDVAPFDAGQQAHALERVSQWARAAGICVVLGMEWITGEGHHIAAAVFSPDGTLQGVQTKNQLDPSEEALYVPGSTRRMFELNGVRFGVAICHEAFRYPETVRWAALRGAQLVFHPHCTGSDRGGRRPEAWGSPASPYYEKAMLCRGLENNIWFASVNYAFRYQDSATSIISPAGECVAHQPYGEEGLLAYDLDLSSATGLLARRYAPERYQEAAS